MIDLAQTIASGQTFAFRASGDGYAGVVDGRPAWIAQQEGELAIRCRAGDETFFRRYFDLDRDYAALLAPYMDDPLLADCVRAYDGMKLLRQPVWEAICAFILSANNHQSRIESLYRGISERFGDRVEWEGETLFSFPAPDRLAAAGDATLRAIGVGYRAPYLIKTAGMVADGFSLELDCVEYDEALAHLMRLSGVGEKVADCVLLFASRHGRAFPVDVWIERVLRDGYGLRGSKSSIKRQAQALFGGEAGIVQQYLFHGARTGLCLSRGEGMPV